MALPELPGYAYFLQIPVEPSLFADIAADFVDINITKTTNNTSTIAHSG